MPSSIRRSLGITVICILSAYQAARIHGQVEPTPPPKAQTDEAWTRFNAAHGGKWTVEWNPVTGSPHRISGSSLAVEGPVRADNVEAVSRRIIEKYRDLLKADPRALVLKSAKVDRPQGAPADRGNWRVAFRQVHGGVPVEGGSVRLVIRGQRLTRLGSDFYPGVDVPTKPSVPLQRALEVVRSDLRAQSLNATTTELIVLPNATPDRILYTLVWAIVTPVVHVPRQEALPDDRPGRTTREEQRKAPPDEILPAQWRYFVDAGTGRILERRNIMVYEDVSGTVTGLVHPFVPADTPVLNPIPHLQVTIRQGLTTFRGETDLSGNYTVSGLAAGPANLEAHFTGAHVSVHNNETADPDATHAAAVTAAGTHDWAWDADDTSPADVETSAFYHVNDMRDWFLRGDPFTVSPLPDPMEVFVRDGEYCNAGASSWGLYFGSGADYCGNRDFALCTDIVYHEYAHRITQKVYDDAAVPLDSEQAGAMNEAWSDYFAATRTNNPLWGGGCYRGRNIDTPDKRFPDDWVGEVHDDGMIFGGALWDLRTALGAVYVDSLAFRAEKQAASSFSEYLGAILEEDDDPLYSVSPLANNDLADGSPNIDTICHVYYEVHGIYEGHCAGHTRGPVAEISSPAPTEFNLFNGSSGTVTMVGTAHGSSSAAFSSFVLEWAPERTPTAFSSAGFTLAGGGTAPVSGAALGTLDITGLADGFYIVRLTVTAGTATATAGTFIVIDRQLLAGWPQLTDIRFYGSPAVADLDTGVAGKEIVAQSEWAVYVFHANGDIMTGWPQYTGGYSPATPAVADLDGDGALEVVAATWNGEVNAFHQDGTGVTGWPTRCGTGAIATPAIADLDGDGDLEVVIGSLTNQICAWHHTGAPVAGWPVTTTDEVASSAALGDLDNDGLPEVVVGSKDGKVYALRGNGGALPGWPLTLPDEVRSSPALGDLDGDGDLEIVVAAAANAYPFGGDVHAWHHTAAAVAGWPRPMSKPALEPSSATIGDIDGDGDLEVLVMSNGDDVHAWQGDGTPIAGWPPAGPAMSGIEYWISSPAIGDIDGDGDQEVVAEGGCYEADSTFLCKMFAFHHDATSVSAWPRFIGSHSNSSPALADLNADGRVEVVIGSLGIYVWSLPGAYSEDTMEWPFDRHDIRRTGTYGPEAAVALLFDTSGSMSLRHDGGWMGVPVAEQRITKAKESAYPFLEMLNDFNAGKARFGISTFPSHPSVGCSGQVVTPMTLINDTTKTVAVSTTVPGLMTENATPLLAGMTVSRALFGNEPRKAIVLLSDGYHNCPSPVTAADPSVSSLISQLSAQSIRVFAIGFGRPSDIDHPLLEALANQTTPPGYTGSQFYDVTTPGFDPSTWDPATALAGTYKAILVDALGLQAAMDPLAVLNPGGTLSRNVRLNEYDRRVSFFLSWVTPQPGRLSLTVRSSDGAPVPTSEAGVRVHQGSTYTILSVGPSFLKQAGKLGPTPWTIEITGGNLQPGESEKLQYSVIVDSALRLRASVGSGANRTGDKLRLTARLLEAGRPIPGLGSVSVRVTSPQDGRGNWFAKNTVTAAQLAQVPLRRGTEKLSATQRRALAIADILKVPFPGRGDGKVVRLHDDGAHGDATAQDGVYTGDWTDTRTEGTYTLQFTADGPTRQGNGFDRDAVVHKYLQVDFAAAHSPVKLVPRAGRVRVTVTPIDAFGNFLGPGYGALVRLLPTHGRMQGGVQDNGDGTYSQFLTLPAGVALKQVVVKLERKAPTRVAQ